MKFILNASEQVALGHGDYLVGAYNQVVENTDFDGAQSVLESLGYGSVGLTGLGHP